MALGSGSSNVLKISQNFGKTWIKYGRKHCWLCENANNSFKTTKTINIERYTKNEC
jgi:hypothetical protein